MIFALSLKDLISTAPAHRKLISPQRCGHCVTFVFAPKNDTILLIFSPDDDPGSRSAQRLDPEHRGPACSAWPLPLRSGSAHAQGHVHGHDELPQRMSAHPAPAAGGQAERLPGRSVEGRAVCGLCA